MSTYKAIFSMQGFTREVDMEGTPSPTIGFSMSGDTRTDESKSLSLYFRLSSFDGERAFYVLYDWREMK